MIPPKRHPTEEANTDSWLMSYADMITLLMCFFIIFVSISEPRKEQIQAITNGMAGKFGTVDLSTPFQSAYQSLQAVIENHKLFKDYAIEKSPTSIAIELGSTAFFKPDSAEFTDGQEDALKETAAALAQVNFLQYTIIVEGHTSDVPTNSGQYPSNWELSSARAAHMARFLIENGIKPENLKVVGYADTKPKVPNLDLNGKPIPENRARNQRVVIHLERVG